MQQHRLRPEEKDGFPISYQQHLTSNGGKRQSMFRASAGSIRTREHGGGGGGTFSSCLHVIDSSHRLV